MSVEPLSIAVRDLLGQCYSLDDILCVEPLADDRHSAAFAIKTASGSYCFKRHRPGKSEQEMSFEEHCLDLLSESPLILQPAHTKSGARHIEHRQRFWSLYPLIESDESFSWDWQQWTELHAAGAGRAMAELHWHTFQLACRCDVHKSGHALSVVPRLAGRFDRSRTIGQRENLPVEALKQLLGQTISDLKDCANDRPILIHGDFHPGNLLYAKREVKAIIDFDFARSEDRYAELAYAVMMFGTDWQSTEGSPLKSPVLCQELLLAYRKHWQNLTGEVISFCPKKFACYYCLAVFLMVDWLLDQIALEESAALEPLEYKLSRGQDTIPAKAVPSQYRSYLKAAIRLLSHPPNLKEILP